MLPFSTRTSRRWQQGSDDLIAAHGSSEIGGGDPVAPEDLLSAMAMHRTRIPSSSKLRRILILRPAAFDKAMPDWYYRKRRTRGE